MLRENESSFTDLLGRKFAYMISEKYVSGHDLLLGQSDSLEFLMTVPDKSVKLIVTSPPYNIGKVYEERVKLDEYLDYQGKIAKECVRVLTDDGKLEETRMEIENSVRSILDRNFIPKPGKSKCDACDFRLLCPYKADLSIGG